MHRMILYLSGQIYMHHMSAHMQLQVWCVALITSECSYVYIIYTDLSSLTAAVVGSCSIAIERTNYYYSADT